MPYENISELPDKVKNNLPKHALEIYQATFNNAWQEYRNASDRKGDSSREETAHKVAWAAVKLKYEKKNNKWKQKDN